MHDEVDEGGRLLQSLGLHDAAGMADVVMSTRSMQTG